jgi:hypothetical protein
MIWHTDNKENVTQSYQIMPIFATWKALPSNTTHAIENNTIKDDLTMFTD